MVTNGDRKTNNFGKLVRQKVGLFSSWFSASGRNQGRITFDVISFCIFHFSIR